MNSFPFNSLRISKILGYRSPPPRVQKMSESAGTRPPRVGENNNNNNNNNNGNGNQSPRVNTITTTTALDRLQNRLKTKSVHNSERSRPVRTNLVRKLQTITEETLPFTTGTIITKSFKENKTFKSNTLNGKITSYDREIQ
jgi:hypothetical protein